jgi:hypothetical protein
MFLGIFGLCEGGILLSQNPCERHFHDDGIHVYSTSSSSAGFTLQTEANCCELPAISRSPVAAYLFFDLMALRLVPYKARISWTFEDQYIVNSCKLMHVGVTDPR